MLEMTALDRIVAHLRRLERGAPDRLQRGLPKEELLSWRGRLSFALTRELEIIYQWRNGTRSDPGDTFESLYLFPGFYFLSIEEAVETYEREKINPEWLDGWFPLFASGGGDFYLVPCTQERVDAAAVIGWIHGEPDKIVEYESVTSMVATLEACFREGAFFLDDDDTMEIDDEQHRVIAARFNPTIPEWLS
jgi:hypothetical protein